ncbi:RPP21 protein, partial [Syrrhaptes paradoxus]|nr:RPP21 protein [Syrrhaptes paradoxus]
QAAHWVLPHSPALARFYCSTQRGAARRLVLRMAPSVKRRMCRRCCSLLLPGSGGCVRLRGEAGGGSGGPPGGGCGGEGAELSPTRVPFAGGGQPRTVLRCRKCGRGRRYLCQ